MDQNNKNKRKISDEEENSLKRTKIDEEKGLEDSSKLASKEKQKIL